MNTVRRSFASLAGRLRIDWPSEGGNRAARETLQANFAAIVLNGFFFPTAGKILGAGLLLTWFLSELTPSAFLISLLVPIQYGVSLLAQPWIGQWISRQGASAPYYRNQALLRALLWAVLAVATIWVSSEDPLLLLVIFFGVVTADAVAAGVGNIAFSDALARVIPKSLRGRARGGRGMAGAIVAGAAGLLINSYVSPDSGLGIFALLFGIAGACYALGGLTFATISEPGTREEKQAGKSRESLKARVREMLGASPYRRFMLVQILLIPVTQGLVFFSLFGRREFGLGLDALGLLLISDAAAPLLGNFLWGKWADRLGNGRILAGAAAVSLLAPAIVLVLASVGEGWPHSAVLAAFGIVVFVVGVSSSGVDLASKNFVLELAPDEHRRPVYIGVNDTLLAIPTMLLAVGGAAIDWFGFPPVFVTIAACSTAAVFLCTTLSRSVSARV